MKNKRNTYLLLALVIAVWGMIIYKMINTLSPDKKVSETEAFYANFEPKALKMQDTFNLSAHERDPFLGILESKTKKTGTKKIRSHPVKKEERPQIPIGFSGMIAGKSTKEHIYFVSINNQQHLMKINDEIQQVKLVKGNAKAISIKYNNQLKTIPITQ